MSVGLSLRIPDLFERKDGYVRREIDNEPCLLDGCRNSCSLHDSLRVEQRLPLAPRESCFVWFVQHADLLLPILPP